MAHMREDPSMHMHRVARVDWNTEEVKQSRTRERSMNLTDLEVFQFALSQRNDESWNRLFARFQGLVLTWIQNHPQCDLTSRYHAPDYYVAQAFEQFRRATTRHPLLVCSELPTALSYLKASLNGAILDTLRSHARSEMPLLEAGQVHPAQRASEYRPPDQELWEAIKQLLSSSCEQRVAYLLFHCGLKPGEVVQFCPDEFPQIEEVYHYRHTIMERLLCHADLLRSCLDEED